MSKMEMVGKIKESMTAKLEAAKAEVAKVEADLEQINALSTELENETAAHAEEVSKAKEEGRQQGISEAGAGDMTEAMKPLNEKIAQLEQEKAQAAEASASQIADLTAQKEALDAKVKELEAAGGYSEDELNAKVQDAVSAAKKEIAAKIKDAQVDDMALASELEA